MRRLSRWFLLVAVAALVAASPAVSTSSRAAACATTPRASHAAPGLSTLSRSWWHRNRVWMGVAGAFHGEGFVADPKGQKIGWYRERRGVLKIYAKLLDGPPASFVSEVPPYYGKIGFQPSGMTFGAAGCWAVTAVVGGQASRFVVQVAPVTR
jgi:hypothetical protein